MLYNQNKKIEKAILNTIVFYDMFDFPLYPHEIWQFCGIKCSLEEVLWTLEDKPEFLEQKSGFYFLRERAEIVGIRQARAYYSRRKFRRALLVARLFKIIPWIRMIAIGNMMGADNMRNESDIDFFIITEPKRIWITRWFCAGIAKLLKLRPSMAKKRDTICLSFYITSDNLHLEKLMLSAELLHDIYFLHWLANLAPIYDRGGVYAELMQKNNWLYAYLPNWSPLNLVPVRDSGPGFSDFYRDMIDMLIGGTDPILKKIQLRIMPDILHRQMNIDTRVVVNDKILKLYVNDRREEFRERYLEKLKMFQGNRAVLQL